MRGGCGELVVEQQDHIPVLRLLIVTYLAVDHALSDVEIK